MPPFSKVQEFNASFSPTYVPTAIFVGGTSGIGQAMAESLAQATNGNCNIILIGRNRAAAESILASFPKPANTNTVHTHRHEFVECDVSLMKNVHATTSALLARLDKVNFLVLSSGILRFSGRRETTEDIDEKLALIYYARWAFIYDLVPLLNKAKDAKEDARVMSILAAGMPVAAGVDVNDLGMIKNYGWLLAMRVAPTYNDLMLEKFAARNPSISFTHIYPGAILTPIYFPVTFPWNVFNPLLYVLLWPFCVSQKRCAEYMMYALRSSGIGFHRCNDKGDDVGMDYYKGTDDAREALWLHSLEATKSKPD